MEHAADAPAWIASLQQGPLGLAMRQSVYLYPLAEVLHILGFATLFGAIVGFDIGTLRRQEPPAYLLAIAAAGLALALPMGALLFVADGAEVWANPMFKAKLVLIALALANVGLFHLGPLRLRRLWAGLSIAGWLAVIVCGRLIAYV